MRKQRNFKGLLVCIMTAILLLTGDITAPMAFAQTKNSKEINIVFTHDVHSHLDTFSTIYKGKDTKIGGFARIKTIFSEQMKENPNTIFVDGGDFSMGTLYQTVYEQEAAELRMMGFLGYDAMTLGNHEFDYRSKGLSNMLHRAVKSGDRLPKMVLCNIDRSKMSKGGKQIDQAFSEYGLTDYTMIKKGNLNIAILGVFGKDALICAPTCELTFEDQAEAVERTIDSIKKNEKADLIICLSHGGTSTDPKKSEDEQLAKKVPELDVIISGHSHTELEKPITVGRTQIVSCGEYGMNVGNLKLIQENGSYKVKEYQLIPVTQEIAEDPATKEKLNEFGANVEKDYLAEFGYTMNQILATNSCKFEEVGTLSLIQKEQPLGSILADAYRFQSQKIQGMDPVDVAMVPAGTIRDTYTKGDITVSDVFNSFSLGIGEDGIPGYPLISCYLTGKELKTAAEIDASIAPLMPTASLYNSGLCYTFLKNRMILNKVTDVYLKNQEGKRVEINNDQLYHVVADLYSGQMLSAVTDMSYGLLSVVPKDKEGHPIKDLETAIIKENGRELKAWAAIAGYMESFEKNPQGMSEVPISYNAPEGRKIVGKAGNFMELFGRLNGYGACIYGVILLLILLFAGTILLIIKRMKKRKSHKK
ncbi:MAG: bifunctional UDP-sugar hydrolase/5'-nucleotidase [Lachnospiraceae bacterium]